MIQESREHVVSMGHKMDTNTAGDPDPQSIERLEEVVSALDSPDEHIEDIAVSAILACCCQTYKPEETSTRLQLACSLLRKDSKPKHAGHSVYNHIYAEERIHTFQGHVS